MSSIVPPLNALRAFEAAARRGSYVAAAEELGVTPAAVSQQVRKLEIWLGKELFLRGPNHIAPTDAGEAVFRGATGALLSLSRMAESLRAPAQARPVVISSIASVSRLWVLPRLADFLAAHPGVAVHLREEADPGDLAPTGIDIRVVYGGRRYPGLIQRPLAADAVQPVCSPRWLADRPAVRAQGCAALADRDLIHTDWGPQFASHPTWASWFAAAGIRRPAPLAGLSTNMAGIALEMAEAGLGVALGMRMLAARTLARGTLVSLSDISAPTGQSYVLVMPPTAAQDRQVIMVADWLAADP